jgi:oligopeptidase B
MLKISVGLISALLLSTSLYSCASTVKQEVSKEIEVQKVEVKAPVARIIPSSKIYGTDNYLDNYAWLRNKNDPAVISYLEEENKYTEEKLKSTKEFQNNLFNEMVSRIKENDNSVPLKIGNYYYYSKTETGKQYRIYCRKYYNLDAIEEVILDPNELVGDSKYFSIGSFEVSPNGKYLAYSVDKDGSESHTLYIKNLETNTLFTDEIPNTSTSVKWSNDNKNIFYITLDSAKRPFQVFRHRLNDDFTRDQIIYTEKDESFYLSLSKSKNQSYIFINSASQITTEVRYIDANKPNSLINLVLPRKYGVEYYVENQNKSFYILTNDNAPNFKLVIAPVNDPSEKKWREIIPHWDTVKIDSIEVFKDFIVVSERENATKKILVINMKNFDLKHIEMPESVYDVSLELNPEYNSSVIRYSYESLTTPLSTFDYDMHSHTKELLKQKEVLGGYNPDNYEAERVLQHLLMVL